MKPKHIRRLLAGLIPDYDPAHANHLKPGDVIPIVKTEPLDTRLGVFAALLEKADLPDYERRMWIERWGYAEYTEDARRKQFEDDFKRAK